jgi:hypothetical protein
MNHTMKTYRGGGGTAPYVLNLRTRWRRVVGFMNRLLYKKKKKVKLSRNGPWSPIGL